MKIRWYKRTGERVSEKKVRVAKDNYAQAKRTGYLGDLRCGIQPEVADRIDRMSLAEFANNTGQFTYRIDK